EYEIFNVALVQKGGYAQADNVHELLVYKEYVSSIDFLGHLYGDHESWKNPRLRAALLDRGKNRLIVPTEGSNDPDEPSRKGVIGGEKRTYRSELASSLGGKAIFDMDGITFGLEVCRDHLLGRLRHSKPGDGDNIVQVHLITSAGASIDPNNVSGALGTWVFCVDGA